MWLKFCSLHNRVCETSDQLSLLYHTKDEWNEAYAELTASSSTCSKSLNKYQEEVGPEFLAFKQ